jgi:polar amino acid transport system substrate-binding protein
MFAVNSQANTEAAHVLIVTEHLPPYQLSENNVLVGGSVGAQIKKLINKVIPESTIEVLTWSRAYKIALVRPNTIIFSLVRTPEREEKFIWIGKVAQIVTELITLKDSELEPIKALSELKNIYIGVKRDDAIASFLVEKGFEYDKNLVEIINTFSTMKMLEKGRIAVIPSNQQVIDFYCQTTGCSTADFKTIYTLKELSEDLYLAASLGTDENLVKQLRAEFAKLSFPNLSQ